MPQGESNGLNFFLSAGGEIGDGAMQYLAVEAVALSQEVTLIRAGM
jgi:uncharacterized protein YgbK (DUF1537 family)